MPRIRRKTLLLAVALVVVGAAITGCAVASPSGSVVTPGPQPAIKTAPKEAWPVRWEDTLAEAKKEGTVVVYANPLGDRAPYQEAFHKAYPGIILDLMFFSGGAELTGKLTKEKEAGIHNVDLVISGTTTILTGAKRFAQSPMPFLVLPEVKDPKVWRDGFHFSDKDQINLVLAYNTRSDVVYNTDLVDPREITSFWDLTKPKWKGKIVIADPTVPGGANSLAFVWYDSPELGQDFVKALAANEPVVTRDRRLLAEGVARGKFAIALAPTTAVLMPFIREGAPIKYAPVMKEGSYATASAGSLAVMKQPAHPAAMVVFLNWLLGKEGMTVLSKTADYYVRRLDVNQDHILPEMRPEPGAKYVETYNEDRVAKSTELMSISKRIFGL